MDVKQGQESHCKFKLKLRLEHSRFISFLFFFSMKHVFIQITQVSAHYFKLLNLVELTQDEKARFIKGKELKLSYFHSFFLRETGYPLTPFRVNDYYV